MLGNVPFAMDMCDSDVKTPDVFTLLWQELNSYTHMLVIYASKSRPKQCPSACLFGQLCNLLFPKPITLDATKEEWLVVLQAKLTPVIRQLIVAVEATPDKFVVTGPLASTSHREVHAIHVLGSYALGLNKDITFWITVSIMLANRWTGSVCIRAFIAVSSGGQAPATAKSESHDGGGEMGLCNAAVDVELLASHVVHDICGFGGAEKADECTITEETEVSIVCNDMNGTAPRRLIS